MSINETQYKIDIKALQCVLEMIHSTPDARLEIEPHRVALTILGEYAWVVHGREDIASVLTRTADRFFEKIDDTPVEPALEIFGHDGITHVTREIPFSYRNATGRIFQGSAGWGGELTLGSIQMRLQDQFVGPDTVKQELKFIVDTLHNFDIGSEEESIESGRQLPTLHNHDTGGG